MVVRIADSGHVCLHHIARINSEYLCVEGERTRQHYISHSIMLSIASKSWKMYNSKYTGKVTLLIWYQLSLTVQCLSTDIPRHPSCGHTISAEEETNGEFTLSQSSADGFCALTFLNPHKLSLNISIHEFDFISTLFNCSEGHMSLYTRPTATREEFPRLIHKYCAKPKRPFLTQLPVLIIILVQRLQTSLHTVTGTFRYTEHDVVDVYRHDPRCGPQTLTGISGDIIVRTDQSVTTCSWVIRAQPGYIILLRLINLDLGSQDTCMTSDHVGLYDGLADLTSLPYKQYCGQIGHHSPWSRQLLSSGHVAGVSFSKAENESTSFRVEWNEVFLSEGTGVCRSRKLFQCKGSKYCLDSDGHICSHQPPFCISRSLKCDYKLNCGLLDKSDEIGCDYDKRRLILTVISSISLVVVAVLCYLYWRHKRRARTRRQQAIAEHIERGRRAACVPNVERKAPPAGAAVVSTNERVDSSANRKTSAPAYLPTGSRRTSTSTQGSKDRHKRRATQPDFNTVEMSFGRSAYR